MYSGVVSSLDWDAAVLVFGIRDLSWVLHVLKSWEKHPVTSKPDPVREKPGFTWRPHTTLRDERCFANNSGNF